MRILNDIWSMQAHVGDPLTCQEREKKTRGTSTRGYRVDYPRVDNFCVDNPRETWMPIKWHFREHSCSSSFAFKFYRFSNLVFSALACYCSFKLYRSCLLAFGCSSLLVILLLLLLASLILFVLAYY